MTLQKLVLDTCESCLRKTGFNDSQICWALQTFHFIFPNIAAFFIFFGSKRAFKVAVLINIIIFILFVSLNGCILTRLERRFTESDYTILDPVLDFLGWEKTHENRVKYSIYSAILCFIGTLIIYYLRFVYKWENDISRGSNSINMEVKIL